MENKYFNIEEFRFKILVESPSGKQIELDSLAQLRIDEASIKEELQFIPSQYMLFASIYQNYKERLDLLEIELDELKSALSKKVRASWDEDADGRCTNKVIDEKIAEDTEIAAKKKDFIKLKTTVGQLFYFCKSLDKKYYSLKSISYMQSAENKQTGTETGEFGEDDGVDIDIHKFEKQKGKIPTN